MCSTEGASAWRTSGRSRSAAPDAKRRHAPARPPDARARTLPAGKERVEGRVEVLDGVAHLQQLLVPQLAFPAGWLGATTVAAEPELRSFSTTSSRRCHGGLTQLFSEAQAASGSVSESTCSELGSAHCEL